MDPRFDKVYQRGYQGKTVVPPPVEDRSMDEAAATQTPRRDPRRVDADIVEPEVDREPEPEPDPATFADLRRSNPWLFATWVVSVVLLVGAIATAIWMTIAFSDPAIFSGPQFIVLLLIPPALFVPGATGVLIALALHALRAGRRSGPTD